MADRVLLLWPKWPLKSKLANFNKWCVDSYLFGPAELRNDHIKSVRCLTSGIMAEMHQITPLTVLEMTEYVYHALAFLFCFVIIIHADGLFDHLSTLWSCKFHKVVISFIDFLPLLSTRVSKYMSTVGETKISCYYLNPRKNLIIFLFFF